MIDGVVQVIPRINLGMLINKGFHLIIDLVEKLVKKEFFVFKMEDKIWKDNGLYELHNQNISKLHLIIRQTVACIPRVDRLE